jgi:hypothetical protein
MSLSCPRVAAAMAPTGAREAQPERRQSLVSCLTQGVHFNGAPLLFVVINNGDDSQKMKPHADSRRPR